MAALAASRALVIQLYRGRVGDDPLPCEATALAALRLALPLLAIGTLLGGFWAWQAWGRLWGWDAKENGALLLILHVAAILHVRHSGLFGRMGVLRLIVLLLVSLSWSWAGVNLLGVGLHAYAPRSIALWLPLGASGAALILVATSLMRGTGSGR
jgi:hypothetical protein